RNLDRGWRGRRRRPYRLLFPGRSDDMQALLEELPGVDSAPCPPRVPRRAATEAAFRSAFPPPHSRAPTMSRSGSCRPVAFAPLLAAALASSASAKGWTPLTNQPPATASTMMLLTDGRVLMNDDGSQHWWILTPDASGSYVNGTWSQAADANYDRLYF